MPSETQHKHAGDSEFIEVFVCKILSKKERFRKVIAKK